MLLDKCSPKQLFHKSKKMINHIIVKASLDSDVHIIVDPR